MSKARKENVPVTPSTLLEAADLLEDYAPLSGIYRGAVVGEDGEVALVFLHPSFEDPLKKSSQLFNDGTFSV